MMLETEQFMQILKQISERSYQLKKKVSLLSGRKVSFDRIRLPQSFVLLLSEWLENRDYEYLEIKFRIKLWQ